MPTGELSSILICFGVLMKTMDQHSKYTHTWAYKQDCGRRFTNQICHYSPFPLKCIIKYLTFLQDFLNPPKFYSQFEPGSKCSTLSQTRICFTIQKTYYPEQNCSGSPISLLLSFNKDYLHSTYVFTPIFRFLSPLDSSALIQAGRVLLQTKAITTSQLSPLIPGHFY